MDNRISMKAMAYRNRRKNINFLSRFSWSEMDPVIEVLIIIASHANEHKKVKTEAAKYPINISPSVHRDKAKVEKTRRIVRKVNHTIRQPNAQVPVIQISSLAIRQYVFEYFK